MLPVKANTGISVPEAGALLKEFARASFCKWWGGMLDSADNLIISQEEAEVLSMSALDHHYYKEAAEKDGYLTPEEYRQYSGGLSRVCHKYVLTVKVNTGILVPEIGALLEEYEVCSSVCQYPAHHRAFRASNDVHYSDCI